MIFIVKDEHNEQRDRVRCIPSNITLFTDQAVCR